ncbi:uncharacterized protein LOC128618678 isoform X2 [Ictalurus furcatus]|uniref:uncharacterized protein LOC128618678 isoform X2 n=1 Tax=Ictalurus furcatus TaxID=66913 RepID=UPI0023508D2F|nr:uncharacterized protein LOC128618678 isoform X2 [Ictalurus furcatus]
MNDLEATLAERASGSDSQRVMVFLILMFCCLGVSTAGVFTAFVGQCVELCCFGTQTTTISCFRGVEEICEITGSTLDRKSSYTGEVVLKSTCLQICNLTEEYNVFYECSQLIEKKKPLCNLSLTVSKPDAFATPSLIRDTASIDNTSSTTNSTRGADDEDWSKKPEIIIIVVLFAAVVLILVLYLMRKRINLGFCHSWRSNGKCDLRKDIELEEGLRENPENGNDLNNSMPSTPMLNQGLGQVTITPRSNQIEVTEQL